MELGHFEQQAYHRYAIDLINRKRNQLLRFAVQIDQLEIDIFETFHYNIETSHSFVEYKYINTK